MSSPPFITVSEPLNGVTQPRAIINITHAESVIVEKDNGAAVAVNYFALVTGVLMTLDTVTKGYKPTVVGGIDAQGPLNVLVLAGADQLKILENLRVGDVISFFQPDGTSISAAHNVTAIATPNITVDGAAVTIPAGGGVIKRDDGDYVGAGTAPLIEGVEFQVGTGGTAADLGQPVYADAGGRLVFSGTVDPDFLQGGTTEALALLPGALLQIQRPT